MIDRKRALLAVLVIVLAGACSEADRGADQVVPAAPAATREGPARPGSPVSPEVYVTPKAAGQLKALGGDILLPTWIPEWAAGEHLVTATPETGAYVVSWSVPYGSDPRTIELDSDLRIQLWSETLDADDEPLPADWPRRETEIRVYALGPSLAAPDCDALEGPDDTVVSWDDATRRYTVQMVPSPACEPQFSVEDALAFADSLRPCVAPGPSVRCT